MHVYRYVVLYVGQCSSYLISDLVEDELNAKLLSRYGVRRSISVNADRFRMGMGPLYYEAFSPLQGEDEERVRKLDGETPQQTNWVTR